MKGWGLGLIVACLCSGQAMAAESAAEAIRAFGLVGAWSQDCSRDPIATCDPKSGCGSRTTYEITPSGAPMIKNVVGTTVPGVGKSFEIMIDSATLAADGKIKITSTMLGVPGEINKLAWLRQPGERWETVLMKDRSKYRAVSAQSEDGKKIFAKDGFVYRPPPGTMPDEIPSNWIRSDQQVQAFAKCSN
jgi:hypothetical protein